MAMRIRLKSITTTMALDLWSAPNVIKKNSRASAVKEIDVYAAPEPRESVATLVFRIGNVDAGHILCRYHEAQQARNPQTRKSPSQSKNSGLRGAKLMR